MVKAKRNTVKKMAHCNKCEQETVHIKQTGVEAYFCKECGTWEVKY